MSQPDPVTTAAGIAIAAFAIDRLVSGSLFLISYRLKWADPSMVGGPDHAQADKSYKLCYFSIAAILALAVCHFGNLSVFDALGFQRKDGVLDAIITTLVIIGGTDRVAALLKSPVSGRVSEEADMPVRVTGTVILLPAGEATLIAEHKKKVPGA